MTLAVLRRTGGGGDEAEAMAMQPARTPAHQALSELRIRNDVKQANGS